MNKTVRNVVITVVVLAVLILAARYLAVSVNIVEMIRRLHGG
jgi:hypothetical protein